MGSKCSIVKSRGVNRRDTKIGFIIAQSELVDFTY